MEYNKVRNIVTQIFGGSLIFLGVLQILASLIGSGIAIIIAGILIILMIIEIKKLQETSQ